MTSMGRPHAAMLPHDELADAEWRVGRTLGGRTLYAVVGGEDRKADVLIGHMDTEQLGERVAADHNARLNPGGIHGRRDVPALVTRVHIAESVAADARTRQQVRVATTIMIGAVLCITASVIAAVAVPILALAGMI